MRILTLALAALMSGLAAAETPSAEWRDAILHNHLDVIRALYAEQDDIDRPTEHGKTALMAAAGAGDLELVEQLLAAGADPEAANHLNGTVLMYAAGSGDADTVRRLLATGVGVNDRASNGWNAIMMATAKNQGELLTVLADAGADPNRADIYGWTPLMRAAFDQHETAFHSLLALPELDLEQTNHNGQTALHLAVIGGNRNMVQALLERGARQISDHNAYTPQVIAAELDRGDLLALLEGIKTPD